MADDLFGKKKDVVPVLDLSRAIVTNKEELKRLMEKVPDYKMRPVKVRPEDIKIKDKDWSFRCPKKETKALLRNNGERELSYTYLDPIPSEMKGGIKLTDLCLVPIDWKMLTTLRPKFKIDEDFFSKLVELGKLQLKTEQKDKRESLFSTSLFGSTNLTHNQAALLATSVRKVKNRAGLVEKRPVTCLECSEEFCYNKGCGDCSYDLFVRVPVNQPSQPLTVKTGNAFPKGRKGAKSPDRKKGKPPTKSGNAKRQESTDKDKKKKKTKSKGKELNKKGKSK